jgi:hypothetical protein
MIYKRLQRHRHANESGVGERLNGDLVDFPRSSPLYRRHRFLPEVISYAVGLYFLFPMSRRKVEEMLEERGIWDLRDLRNPAPVWALARGRSECLRSRRPGPATKRQSRGAAAVLLQR